MATVTPAESERVHRAPSATTRARPRARAARQCRRIIDVSTTPKRLAAFAFASALAFGACSNSGASTAPSAASTAPSVAPSTAASATARASAAAVTGSIIVSGSSTVEPISTAIAQSFKAANPDFKYTIDGPGTGDGFKRFCAGETDISDASRKIKPEGEADVCATAGIEF